MKQREQLSGWLCLLAGVLHLLAPLCPACPALNPKAQAKADAMGRVTAESSRGQVHHYEYDLAGNRVKASYSTGRIVETSYDGLNRPEAIVDGDRLTRYGYDKAGRAVILVAANGQTSSNTYDALGRLTDRTLFRTPAMSESEVLAEFSWSHDLLGNVTAQYETWPGAADRLPGIRSTFMGYDANNRLTSEIITQPEDNGATPTTTTIYAYDDANNRSTKTVTRTIAGEEPVSDEDTGHWAYTYNSANQLVSWTKRSEAGNATVQKSATLTYDDAGNRTSQSVTETVQPSVPTGTHPGAAQPGLTQYSWDAQDRLSSVTLPDGSVHRYAYDYRTRRVGTSRSGGSLPPSSTAIVFAGGLSVAEWEQESGTGLQPVLSAPPTVEYTRGPDMGGGVGGLLYSKRGSSLKYNLSNGRGDIVAQADQYASLTWTASYEAYGKRTKETGENLDKQRGNSKDEDPTGLLNEGFRYRDIETGVWLSRDPAGFVDGPNLYAYIKCNPWSAFDPDGLLTKKEAQKKRSALDENEKKVIDDYRKSNMSDAEKEKAIQTVKEQHDADRKDLDERITKIEKTAKDMAKIYGHDQAYHEEHLDDDKPQDKQLIEMLEHAEANGFREGIVNTMAGDFKDAGVAFVKDQVMKRLMRGLKGKLDKLGIGPDRGKKPLPALDSTGKVHGSLPRPQELKNYSREELEDLRDELTQSAQKRIEKTADLGSDPGHGERQAAEQALIHSINKLLGK